MCSWLRAYARPSSCAAQRLSGRVSRPEREIQRSREPARGLLHRVGTEGERRAWDRFHSGKGGGAHSQGATRTTGPYPKRGRRPQDRPVGRARRVAGAVEDKTERAFVHFGSTKVVPACTRRGAIRMHGKGKTRTLHLVVPCKEKRNSDGEVTKIKVRITAADLVSNGKIANTVAANRAGETSRLLTQLELGLPGARTLHKDVGGAYFHWKQPPVDSEGGGRDLCSHHGGGADLAPATACASTRSRGGSPWHCR